MKVFRSSEMREADKAAAEAGVPTLLLMEAAGRAVADSAVQNFGECRRPLVLCGKGNNGGDGYVAARYLRTFGLDVTVLEQANELPEGDTVTARAACLAHLPVQPLEIGSLDMALAGCDLVIDALLGTGLREPLRNEMAAIVELVNASGMPVLAVDLPSGIAADVPFPPGKHVRATRTVQLGGPKISSLFDPAREAYGVQEIADIGIPERILERSSKNRLLSWASPGGIPRRSRSTHKYEVGTVTVIAGSPRYMGAAELACRGAYRGGAGLVTLAAEGRLPSSWPEIIFSAVDWSTEPVAGLDELGGKRAQALVAGPGLDDRALPHLPGLLRRLAEPWVLDADALRPGDGLREAVGEHGRCVLTPHVGEAARLLQVSAADVLARPLESAQRIAHDWNAVCVLKGGTTVVAGPRGELAVHPGGHPGMATGGTGDVLAGLLGAFLAAGGDLLERTEAAVLVHSRAGALAGAEKGIGLVAGDLVERLPAAMLELAEHQR